jgi:hypothetical protein
MYVHAAVACSQPTDGKAFMLAMQVRSALCVAAGNGLGLAGLSGQIMLVFFT